MAGSDVKDSYSRAHPIGALRAMPRAIKVGVPRPSERVFFGDNQAAADYAAALDRLGSLGADISEIDIEPFYEAARLLYEGPWVAERYAATETLDRLLARRDASGDARDHHGRCAAERGRGLQGLLPAGRAAPRRGACVPSDRGAGAAHSANSLYD